MGSSYPSNRPQLPKLLARHLRPPPLRPHHLSPVPPSALTPSALTTQNPRGSPHAFPCSNPTRCTSKTIWSSSAKFPWLPTPGAMLH